MEITTNESGEIVLSNVFNSVVIETENGSFGVCERDGNLNVVVDGRTIWSSDMPDHEVMHTDYTKATEEYAKLANHHDKMHDGCDHIVYRP